MQKVKPMGGDWIREVRGMLFALAQTTDTPLPPANVQDVYIRKLFEAAGDGKYSVLLISESIELLIEGWKWPSFPKVSDILGKMKDVRNSYKFRDRVRVLSVPELPEQASDSDEDRNRVADVINKWRLRGGTDFKELTDMLRKDGG